MPKNLIRRGSTYYFCKVVGGKKVRKVLGSNFTEARRLARTLTDRYRELPAPSGTVREFGERWLTEYVGQRRNLKGVHLARQRFQDHVAPTLGGILLLEVKPEQIRQLRANLTRNGLAAQSVKHILSDVRCLFRYAVDVGALNRTPFPRSVMPAIPETEPKRLTREELDKILAVASQDQAFMIRLSLATGLRWSELRDLRWNQVRELPEPHLVLERTKNGKVRRVPLSGEGWGLIHGVRRRAMSVYVLPQRPEKACGIYARLGERSGVRWYWHQLRHTFAAEYLERGGSIEMLRLLLGHSTVKVTERYARVSDRAMFEEFRRVESGLMSGLTERFTGSS